MARARVIALILGLGLFVLVLFQVDLTQVMARVGELGLIGALIVVFLYLFAFVLDSASWQLMLPSARLSLSWLGRLWMIRMAGEAFNILLPTTVGGEPIKALLLRKRYAIDYREGGASLVMAKTVNLMGLFAFSAAGFGLMLAYQILPPVFHLATAVGFAALGLGVLALFAMQRWRFFSWLTAALANHRFGRPLERALASIQAVDDHFHRFYRGRPGRFIASFVLAFTNWSLGAVEIYVIMAFLGQPVGWGEAWVIEMVSQLVRAGTFFIPASLGASEVGFVLVIEALTGRPALGLAVALIRRGREMLWIAVGLMLAWHFSLRPTADLAARAGADGGQP